ncbi:MAG: DUF6876 family protein [Bacteroidota bacterium]
MQQATELLTNLAQFTGTQNYYFHPLFKKYHYTDGVRYLAQKGECYWLLEFIFGHQSNTQISNTPFQVWTIVKDGDKATITVSDGNDNIIRTFQLNYTSFPLDEYTLWMIDGVLLLKSEY